MKITIALDGGHSLVAEVDAAVLAQAHRLLARVAPVAGQMQGGDVERIEVEWAVLQLRADGNAVTVEEPAYRTDPRTFVPSITLTSRVFDAQARLLQRLGVAAAPVQARALVRVADDALQAAQVVGVRQPDTAPFTGWQIEPATLPLRAGAAHGQYAASELAAIHLPWIAALCLPPGWAFRMAGRVLVDAVTPAGATIALNLLVDV